MASYVEPSTIGKSGGIIAVNSTPPILNGHNDSHARQASEVAPERLIDKQSNDSSTRTPPSPRNTAGMVESGRAHDHSQQPSTGTSEHHDQRRASALLLDIPESTNGAQDPSMTHVTHIQHDQAPARPHAGFRRVSVLANVRNDRSVLCQTCQDLRLDVHNFIIDGDEPNASNHTRHRPFLGHKSLGTLTTISASATSRTPCPLCQLFVAAIERAPGANGTDVVARDPEALCEISWVLDGREMSGESNKGAKIVHRKTRRICVEWRGQWPYARAYLVLIAPKARFKRYGEYDVSGKWQPPSLFLGRLLTSLDTMRTDETIEKWYTICSEKHLGCKVVKSSVFEKRKERYFALSYTWGSDESTTNTASPSNRSPGSSGPPGLRAGTPSTALEQERFKTNQRNVDKLREKNGIKDIWTELPETIRNAIDLTKKLNCRYIWVDSICIIQDSKRNWKLNADVMDLVYGNADLTICAADGNQITTPLRALFQTPQVQADRVNSQVKAQYKHPEEPDNAFDLLLSFPAEAYIEQSKWNHRGWTFQERVLSKRCLIFTDGKIHFQCHSGHMSEDIYAEDAISGWSIELSEAPAQTFRNLDSEPLMVYKKSLEMYTTRRLKRENDILAAFKGLAKVTCNCLGGQPLFGLPSSHFDWALLWEPTSAPQRRVSGGEEMDFSDEVGFPSWSWCGWKGQQISYKRATVDGPEINLHEWLMNHTWIIWYIRSGNGDLRLVWDAELERNALEMRQLEEMRRGKPQVERRHTDLKGSSKGYRTLGNYEGGERDLYGRPLSHVPPEEAREHPGKFQHTIYPWMAQVTMLEPGEERITDDPDHRYLQFFTWSAKFRLRREETPGTLGRATSVGVQVTSNLSRYAIVEQNDDLVGTIMLDTAWASTLDLTQPQEFIAISEAKDIDQDEWKGWNFYIERVRFDADWNFYHVLLLRYDHESGKKIAERAGLGKMFQAAFENACENEDGTPSKQWKEIILG